MSKRILGWLRQRCVAVVYGVVWGLLVVAIVFFFRKTLMIISVQVDKENVQPVRLIYCSSLLFLILGNGVGQIISWKRKSWQQSRPILTVRLILIAAFSFIYAIVVCLPNGVGEGFYIGGGTPERALVSLHEVSFVMVLSWLGTLFQSVLIDFEGRQKEVNKVIGGTLIVMGIVMPELLKSWSLLGVYCGEECCTSDQLEVFVLFKMGIACAVGLSVMFVVGLFLGLIVQFIRSSEEELSVMSRESSLADSHNAEVPVSEREIATASDKQNKESEELPASSSVATRMSQEAADGVAIPAQATEALASTCGPGVAVSKQLMGAAVSGLVAGACFSVVNHLFRRR